jgi:hypothetical protein
MKFGILLVATLGVALSAAAKPAQGNLASLPPALAKAFQKVHRTAEASPVRNLFMFNYTYFADGLCRDQDCSEQKIETEKTNAKNKMGDDFLKYSPQLKAYSKSLSRILSQLPTRDMGTLTGQRTAAQVMESGAFVTCVDFAKAVLAKAIQYGFPQEDLRMYVVMNEEAYKKMCPVADGRQPILPRPVIHTLVAYRDQGQWYALNVEDPQAVAIPLGAELPKRLDRTHQFTFPALIAYQKLIYAGSFSPADFINGYNVNWLLSMTAAGKLESNPSLVTCE